MTGAYEIYPITWRGIAIRISYADNWLNMAARGYDTAHIEVMSIDPDRAPLPITETGYKSHFTSAETVAAYGGPEAFVQRWLEEEAKSREWKAYEAQSRQMSLF
jgi:hypothetical protein